MRTLLLVLLVSLSACDVTDVTPPCTEWIFGAPNLDSLRAVVPTDSLYFLSDTLAVRRIHDDLCSHYR